MKPLCLPLSGNRRYYNQTNIRLLKKIKFLLKDQGMTIKGVKKLLNSSHSNELDEISNKSIRTNNLRNKISNISQIIKEEIYGINLNEEKAQYDREGIVYVAEKDRGKLMIPRGEDGWSGYSVADGQEALEEYSNENPGRNFVLVRFRLEEV